MTKIYKLQNKIKHYEWGSLNLIPQFIGEENSKGVPYAELWIGTNKGAPSKVYGKTLHCKMVDLEEISGELPFLFKLLAVEKPLSIQVHPNKTQAEEGFKREEEAGLPLQSPARNYKDPNHKPEILCAVSPFTLMAGFRKPEEIQKSLEELITMIPQIKEIITPLLHSLKNCPLHDFFRILFNFSEIELEYITNLINEKVIITEIGVGEHGKVISVYQWKLMKKLAALYPKEIGILSPIFMNLITLKPGQSIFVPAGLLHCYISGFGVELMANSDNVLRCGLTPKYVDIPEVLKIVDFNPHKLPVSSPDNSSWYCYSHPCKEFTLAFMRCDGSEKLFPEKGPAICIVTEGELLADGIKIKKGESFFIPKEAESLSFSGNFSLFAALVPKAL